MAPLRSRGARESGAPHGRGSPSWRGALARTAGATRRETSASRWRAQARPGIALGSHLDSVPSGGWLELGCMVGSASCARGRESGERPSRDLVLVDWARRARGSATACSAAWRWEPWNPRRCGAARPRCVMIPPLAENDVEIATAVARQAAGARRRRLPRAPHRAGPEVLESESGQYRRRRRLRWIRATAVSLLRPSRACGTTPMNCVRTRGLAAARAVVERNRRCARRGRHHRRAHPAPGDHHGRRGRGRARGRSPARRRGFAREVR